MLLFMAYSIKVLASVLCATMIAVLSIILGFIIYILIDTET